MEHRIIHGDVYGALRRLDDGSVDCAITSPPYWNQRNYGYNSQIGNEETVGEYFQNLTAVYSLLRRKLTGRGIFFHNIGDKYINKYGNTPLGMIPYRLAYHMRNEGWHLEDIIIWYKPNHMPSSVKNRFTNTYEPVFVFARSEDNYYADYRMRHPEFRSFLKVPLQQVSHAHMATYPERLIENLLQLGIPDDGLVLDPFAGSGTTCKAVQNLNKKRQAARKCVLIEANADYIDIIRKRCALSKGAITTADYIDYDHSKIKIESRITVKEPENEAELDNIESKQMIIKRITSNDEFWDYIPYLRSDSYSDLLNDDGLLFIVLPDYGIDKLYALSRMDKWVVRNMIVLTDGTQRGSWKPVFFLVKDTKIVRYKFNLDNVRIDHKTEDETDLSAIEYVGMAVKKGSNYFKDPADGKIIGIPEFYENGLPRWIAVEWDSSQSDEQSKKKKDKAFTVEGVINHHDIAEKKEFFCPGCGSQLVRYHHGRRDVKCTQCDLTLWKDKESIPAIKLRGLGTQESPTLHLEDLSEQNQDVANQSDDRDTNGGTKADYNGKFKGAERINMGQSPGARASVDDTYFSMQRYYSVKQSMFSDYLNIHRKAKGYTKKELTSMFPDPYKHTVGHWIRKDMGGSLPKPGDLLKLQEILDLDDDYVRLVNTYGAKLQTVLASKKGKNPGDFLEKTEAEVIEMLKKLDPRL